MELAETADSQTSSFVIDFTWRASTVTTFCESGADASTKSALVKADVYNEDEDEWDTLKFRLMLWPANKTVGEIVRSDRPSSSSGGAAAAAAAAPASAPAPESKQESTLQQHKIVLQLVGKGTSQVYHLSFHTINPNYQVHVKVPDHRIPIFESQELVHKWHAMIVGLKETPAIRMLVRIKPDGSGPLGDMCGCC